MNSQRIHNLIQYKFRRRHLRNNMTDAEIVLWSRLKNKQLGFKFRRQHGIGHYIVDFYCPEMKLVVEVDGSHHNKKDYKEYDQGRDQELGNLGLTVLRFRNQEILGDIKGVIREILNQIKKQKKV